MSDEEGAQLAPAGRKPAGVARRFGLWLWYNFVPGVVVSIVMLALLAAGGEIYLRSRASSFVTSWPLKFDPRIGFVFTPGAEVATTNNLDFWTRQRANSLGFLDREPVAPEARPGSCHVALIGDSFVEAHQVEIPQKAQVVLEKLAAERVPQLKLTTSAFGISDTGQLGQLPFYDEFARKQAPKIVVLVVVKNDFADNSALLQAVVHGRDPEHMPRLFARARAEGGFELQPIDPDWQKNILTPRFEGPPPNAVRGWLLRESLVYRWAEETAWRVVLVLGRWWYGSGAVAYGANQIMHYADILAKRPQYVHALDGWDAEAYPAVDEVFFEPQLPPVFYDALRLTGFALDEFKDRARRDGFKLLILATQTMTRDDSTRALDRLKQLAEARDIPVIDQQDYIERHGGRARDARLLYDGHWSPQGHTWAAGALLDYIVQNSELCR